ncbi:MAG: TonB-dependent receptor [Muribaculaceae bacterium]|nr:TonB-dependent receptor [Muribaculaceae bacterium]
MKRLLTLMAVMTAIVASALGQRTASGYVYSVSDDQPVVGATVLVKGTTIGTSTDLDGNFTIKNIPANASKLVVSYVGMLAQEVSIGEDLKIGLHSDAHELDDLMVVAYGTAKKSEYTGAASVVNAETLENRLVTNVTNALNGAVAGVQTLNDNGQPGVGSKVRIRGVGSINASMTPLYVLDGVPYDGDIAALNPSDIESITVLKDAAAAALYGARGANGVILVTTKRGKMGTTKVTVDAKWGANSREVTNYDVISSPATYYELSYAAQRNAALYNLGYDADRAHAYANSQMLSALGYQVYTVPDGETLIGPNGKLNPNATLGYRYGNYYFTPDDWGKETFRNGLRQEYNVSVSGANDKFNYYFNGGYTKDEGTIKNSSYERLSTRLSVDYNVTKWLKLGTNISYAYAKSDYPRDMDSDSSTSNGNAFYAANNVAPIYPIYVRDAEGNIVYDESYNKPVYDYGDAKSTPLARPIITNGNPAGQLIYDSREYLTDLFNGKWYLKLTPVDGLTLTGTLGYTVNNTRYHMVLNGIYGQFTTQGGNATQESDRTSGLTIQGIANYQHTFNDVHNLQAMVGYESYDYKSEYVQGSGMGLYNPFSWAVNNTLMNDARRGYGAYNEYATRGIFGQINYNYDTRYFLTGMYRRDASSRFAPDHRWGNFFSVSAAWDIAKEHFMDASHNWLNQLKLRASFGQQGNDNLWNGVGVGSYYYYAYMDQYSIDGTTSWSDGVLAFKGNPDITWETSNSFNIGLDYAFLDGKVTGTLEYFNRQTSDMLYNRPVAPSLGYNTIPMNIGSMRNYGMELEVNYKPIKTDKIDWSINFNGTWINNKILKLAPELNGEWISGSRIYREGESMYQLYLVKYAGVDPATGKSLYWGWDYDKDTNEKIEGSYHVKDTYDTKDRQCSGNLLPKFYGGFGTNLSLYGFDISVAFSYQAGGKIYDSGYKNLMGSGYSSDYGHAWHKDILNAWTPENRFTDVPRLDATDSYTFSSGNVVTDRALVSSNYLSLNNITVGYTIPASVTKKFGVSALRVYFSGDNIALWSARKGLDPRQDFVSATTSTYTAVRCLSGGIKIEF